MCKFNILKITRNKVVKVWDPNYIKLTQKEKKTLDISAKEKLCPYNGVNSKNK